MGSNKKLDKAFDEAKGQGNSLIWTDEETGETKIIPLKGTGIKIRAIKILDDGAEVEVPIKQDD